MPLKQEVIIFDIYSILAFAFESCKGGK